MGRHLNRRIFAGYLKLLVRIKRISMIHISRVLVVLLLSGLLLSSCATVNSYQFGEAQQAGEPYEKRWVNQYLGYSVGKNHIQTACPEGQQVVQHRVWLKPGQWWIGFFTLWIYSPVTAGYWCGETG